MSFIETNLVKKEKVLVKAHYDRILLMPFVTMGALIALVGLLIKLLGPGLLEKLINDPEYSASRFAAWGNEIFILFLIAGIGFAWFKIIRTTGIELAATDSLLIGRYGNDAMCVPIEKIENLAIYKNLLGKIFQYGTVIIGTPSITMKFPYISEPEKFRNKLLELQEERLRKK